MDADATPRTLTLTFTTQNWAVEQAVTVRVGSDAGADDETLTVEHTVSNYVGRCHGAVFGGSGAGLGRGGDGLRSGRGGVGVGGWIERGDVHGGAVGAADGAGDGAAVERRRRARVRRQRAAG